jgi:predicted transcriptional regulator
MFSYVLAEYLPIASRCDTMYYMSTLTLRIPDDLKAQLEQLSRQLRRPTSELVRESLRRYIVTEQLKAIRRATVPLAEAQGFLTDDDVFQAVS